MTGSHKMHEGFPSISVGILSYERPQFLSHVLHSVARQKYPNLEILISDNGSTNPEVRPLLEKFTAEQPGTRLFLHKENRGAFWNFRFVLEQATGDYFLWLADDDFWSDDFLGELVRHQSEDRPRLVYPKCCTKNLATGQLGAPVKERPSAPAGWQNILHQTLFDSDGMIYGIFPRLEGLRFVKLLKAWKVPERWQKRFPTMSVDFTSYAFLYGLLLSCDFVNISHSTATHFMIDRPIVARQQSTHIGQRFLNILLVIVSQAYIHILLTGRFLQASLLARRPIGILLAPFAAGFLFCRRLVNAARRS